MCMGGARTLHQLVGGGICELGRIFLTPERNVVGQFCRGKHARSRGLEDCV